MTWGKYYWPIWMLFTFLAFIGPEVYAVSTNWRNTLSNWVWNALHVSEGQPISHWIWAHVLVFGCFLTINIWLAGHLFLGWWRG